MKIIEGFEQSKKALSRQGPSLETFGTDDRETEIREWLEDVRRRGDAALIDYTLKFDGVKLTSLEVTEAQVRVAYDEVDAGLVAALKLAAGRISAYHAAQKESLLKENINDGMGWLVRPLNRIGVHTPGFTAPLPSSLLMTVIPARVAGVKEVILVTPPRKQGGVSPLILVAADIAGVDRIFSVGGAQAIAALAFGTEIIPAVDKICGPGNIFVTLAKKLLYGVVGIDGLFGPSEVLIIADQTANPAYCAADLLAQAEHSLGLAVLVTFSKEMAAAIVAETERQLTDLPRPDLARQSLEERGVVAVVSDMDEAIELSNLYAPEHLCLMVKGADSYLDGIYNAGCIVIGEEATVVPGDYVAGPSHVLPTGGTARFGSPLNVTDFIKLTSLISLDEVTLKKLGPAARALAEAEGLDAHAKAVQKRLE
ncbi:MAG: histidinol dehydrogenase [Dehalococcoidales bacterium]|nr:histidinol dehydrogenase [Dehalococcoidales bacterium]